MDTTDNKTYYKRYNYDVKITSVNNFINKLDNIGKIIDFGCNNGDVSKHLSNEFISVTGIDFSTNLDIPKDYDFINTNIVEYRGDIRCDSAIFLSLYHHIFGKYGMGVADDLFYRIFFNTKYLIFDSGNLSEKNRAGTYWFNEQKKHFKNEKDLLDHFGLKYDIISDYKVGGGVRSIVIFKNDGDINYSEKTYFQRMVGSKFSNKGLFEKNSIADLFTNTLFTKLKVGNKTFFTKKHKNDSWNVKELKNTILINERYDKKYLIKFYGYNEKYGLIFEYIKNFEYIGKTKIKTEYINLIDVDKIKVNNTIKYIDFHR